MEVRMDEWSKMNAVIHIIFVPTVRVTVTFFLPVPYLYFFFCLILFRFDNTSAATTTSGAATTGILSTKMIDFKW